MKTTFGMLIEPVWRCEQLLIAQQLPDSTNQEATGWYVRILSPRGQPVHVPNMDGPFSSQLQAEVFAEQVARNNAEQQGTPMPPEEKPAWAVAQDV